MTKEKEESKTDQIVKTAGVDVLTLASYKSQASELVAFLEGTPCKTPRAEAWFSSQLTNVRALQKAIDGERTNLTKPILAAKKAIDALFQPALKPLERCEEVIRGKLAGAAQLRLAAEKAAMQLAQSAAEAGDTEAVMAALAEVPDVVATTGSTSYFVWKVGTVVGDLVPDQYKVVDMAALATIAKACKGSDEPPMIPGVHWEKIAMIRAKG